MLQCKGLNVILLVILFQIILNIFTYFFFHHLQVSPDLKEMEQIS